MWYSKYIHHTSLQTSAHELTSVTSVPSFVVTWRLCITSEKLVLGTIFKRIPAQTAFVFVEARAIVSLGLFGESITNVLLILRPVPIRIRPFLSLARLLLLRLRRSAGIASLLPLFSLFQSASSFSSWENVTSWQRMGCLQSKNFKKSNSHLETNDVNHDVNRLWAQTCTCYRRVTYTNPIMGRSLLWAYLLVHNTEYDNTPALQLSKRAILALVRVIPRTDHVFNIVPITSFSLISIIRVFIRRGHRQKGVTVRTICYLHV